METIVIDRIRCLWKYREWYRSHLGWIPQQQLDDRAELRYLIGLLREWRRVESGRPDPVTAAKAADDLAGWTSGELQEAFGR